MASASGFFRTTNDLLNDGFEVSGLEAKRALESFVPLFDAKLARQYEWRAANLELSGNQFRKVAKSASSLQQLKDPSYIPAFAYWVPTAEAESRIGSWPSQWLLGLKDVTGVTSTRLAVFAVVPRIGIGHTFPLLKLPQGGPGGNALMLAWMNSLIVEFFLRQRMQGLHLTWHLLSQIPTPSIRDTALPCPWDASTELAAWVIPRVVELTVTSSHLSSFSADLGFDGTVFVYDTTRRRLIQAELDAAFFVVMGFAAPEVEFVLDSLEKIKARDQETFGAYETRRLVLDVYNRMQNATKAKLAYETLLDPPAADPRVAHPSFPSRTRTLA